ACSRRGATAGPTSSPYGAPAPPRRRGSWAASTLFRPPRRWGASIPLPSIRRSRRTAGCGPGRRRRRAAAVTSCASTRGRRGRRGGGGGGRRADGGGVRAGRVCRGGWGAAVGGWRGGGAGGGGGVGPARWRGGGGGGAGIPPGWPGRVCQRGRARQAVQATSR